MLDGADEPWVAGEAEDVVGAIVLAPIHEIVACKAAVGAQDDAHVVPALVDLSHNARDLVLGAVGRVLVGAAQFGCQQMPTSGAQSPRLGISDWPSTPHTGSWCSRS